MDVIHIRNTISDNINPLVHHEKKIKGVNRHLFDYSAFAALRPLTNSSTTSGLDLRYSLAASLP